MLAAASGGVNLASVQQAVLADAAARTGVPSQALRVVQALAVTWPDGAIGCPQPGLSYTQALVPGYLVRVQHGDTELRYHADAGGRFVLCPADRATAPAPGPPR